jgi:transcriptional regulator with XRE-family HTH domain
MTNTLENLRIFRTMYGITQEFMAYKLGVSHTAYAKIERGETILSEDKITKICEIIGIETNTLKNFDKKNYLK